MAIEKVLEKAEYTPILDVPIKYFNKAMLDELKQTLDLGSLVKARNSGTMSPVPSSKSGQMIMMKLEERRLYSKLEMMGKQVIKMMQRSNRDFQDDQLKNFSKMTKMILQQGADIEMTSQIIKTLQFQNHKHDLETLHRFEKNETRVCDLEKRLEKKVDLNFTFLDQLQNKVNQQGIIINSYEDKFKNSRGTMDVFEKKILATEATVESYMDSMKNKLSEKIVETMTHKNKLLNSQINNLSDTIEK